MSKKQKKDKAAYSTRQLMGIEEIKDYCIATRMGNLVFFIIKPTNISVLPDSSISARIYALLNVKRTGGDRDAGAQFQRILRAQ